MTIEFNGVGGLMEGDFGTADINVNLDSVLNLSGTDEYLINSATAGENFRSSDASGTFSASTGDCSVGTTTSNFQIGARTTNTGAISSAFDGEIGLIMLYTKELTLTEIKQNYNSQKVRFGL